MTTSNNRAGYGNRLHASIAASGFDSPISVPVDTLFSMQVKALLANTQQQLKCQAIKLKLLTCSAPSLGRPPFLSSKKTLNFNGLNKEEQALSFQSEHCNGSLLTSGDDKVRQCKLDINFESSAVGELIVLSDHPKSASIGSENLKLKLEQYITRATAQEKVKRWFGEPNLWCGISQNMQLAEYQLSLFSKNRQPILIKGDKGSGKKLAALYAASVHAHEKVPFVQLPEPKQSLAISAEELRQALSHAQGGALYINKPLSLSLDAQRVLKRFCEQSDWNTQVVIALSPDKYECEPFVVWLEYHCQTLALPSFEQRRDDLRFICYQYLHSIGSPTCSDFSSNVYAELCYSGAFQSVADVHQFIDKIRHSIKPDKLTVSDLRPLLSEEFRCNKNNGHDKHASIGSQRQRLVIPLGKLYASQFAESLNPSQEHPAILKALTYMAEHYQHSFSLQDLAEQAFVSPSHLSYLLKKRFGKSFKGLLIEFRIEKAQEILREFPVRQITQVCIDVGFLDLSHFEKTFKKMTGLTPRNYRDKHKQTLSISKS